MSKKDSLALSKSKSREAWLDALHRRQGVRNLPERFLIVCEDTTSAVNYFLALNKDLGLSFSSVRVAGSGGRTQPIQVVTRAIELKKEVEENKENDAIPYGQVWCVIDGDYGKKIINARAKATANDIKLAISTKCFEHWILLHYEENDIASLDCDRVIAKLKPKHIEDYEKGNYQFAETVKLVVVASKRARSLRKPGEDRGQLPEDQNPCSEVYKLIDAILKARG